MSLPSSKNISHGAISDQSTTINNGGPTETIAELASSLSIDAIPFADCTYPSGALNPCTEPLAITSSTQLNCDQRGLPRPDQAKPKG
jgi:hypothetical protein